MPVASFIPPLDMMRAAAGPGPAVQNAAPNYGGGRRHPPPATARRQAGVVAVAGLSWVEILGLGVVTVNSGMAMYRSQGDVAFIAATYLALVALFFCLRTFVRAPPSSPRRSRLMGPIWLLTMSLTFEYVYEVTGTTAPTLNVALLVWAMPAATGIAMFFVFFQENGFYLPWDEEMLPL